MSQEPKPLKRKWANTDTSGHERKEIKAKYKFDTKNRELEVGRLYDYGGDGEHSFSFDTLKKVVIQAELEGKTFPSSSSSTHQRRNGMTTNHTSRAS